MQTKQTHASNLVLASTGNRTTMSLAWLVQDLLDDTVSTVKVSQQDYQSWAAGFIFEGLRNQRYGQSFCNRFAIRDYSLFFMRSVTQADAHIRKHYVLKNTVRPV